MISQSLIVTDVDGVLLNWDHSFARWIRSHGYSIQDASSYLLAPRYGISEDRVMELVTYFNESADMAFLPALRDSIYYVKRLHEQHGFVFHAITSFGTNRNAAKLRQQNLNRIFGETVFEDLTCLPVNSCKRSALEQYRGTGCYWIEDKVENAAAGEELGLCPVMIAHEYNSVHPSYIPRVNTWREVYGMITGT
jgi:hypothetical protein